MKEIKSKTQPNPKECTIWVDLTADPHGSIRKYWDGAKWVSSNNDSKSFENIVKIFEEMTQSLAAELTELKEKVNTIKLYDDQPMQIKLKSLTDRVHKLEQLFED